MMYCSGSIIIITSITLTLTMTIAIAGVPYDANINHQNHYHHKYPNHANDSLVTIQNNHHHNNTDHHHQGHDFQASSVIEIHCITSTRLIIHKIAILLLQ
ncbi:MAG: hypothetical protein WKF59_23535 [Chitinophagaceae bacterium]